MDMIDDQIQELVHQHYNRGYEGPDFDGLLLDLADIFPLPDNIRQQGLEGLKQGQVSEKLIDYAHQIYDLREKQMGADEMRLLERLVMLRVIDDLWKVHLTEMDHLRQSVGLQSVRQIDPLVVYKKEGGDYFESLMAGIKHDIVHFIYKANLEKREAPRPPQQVPAGGKVGRNDPCPCGSGKKYKHCHGK